MRALLPQDSPQVDDDYLLERYSSAQRPFVRFNFVSSIDGSSQADGLSGALGSPGDRRVFALLRRLADVILVGAGTVRAEGYEGQLLSEQDIAWRTAQGMSPQPILALVSHGMNIESTAPVFTQSPVPIVLFTSVQVNDEQRRSYGANVSIIQVGESDGACNPADIIEYLSGNGYGFIHAEGGPHILGQFATAGQVDSICVSYSPVLVAGDGMRIAVHDQQTFQQFGLSSLFEEEGMLFCDYRLKKSAESPQE